jgi:hypothetical protein
LGSEKNTRNEKWFDEECANFIEEKNKARKKMIERETRSNCEKYYELRKRAYKICKKKKKESIKKQIDEIDRLNVQNERRKFYRAVDKFKKKDFNQE